MALGLRKRFGLTLGLSACSFAVFLAFHLVAIFRRDWLGIDSSNAADNFAFAFAIVIPALLTSSLISSFAVFFYVSSVRALRRRSERASRWELATVVPALPPLLHALATVSLIVWSVLNAAAS